MLPVPAGVHDGAVAASMQVYGAATSVAEYPPQPTRLTRSGSAPALTSSKASLAMPAICFHLSFKHCPQECCPQESSWLTPHEPPVHLVLTPAEAAPSVPADPWRRETTSMPSWQLRRGLPATPSHSYSSREPCRPSASRPRWYRWGLGCSAAQKLHADVLGGGELLAEAW